MRLVRHWPTCLAVVLAIAALAGCEPRATGASPPAGSASASPMRVHLNLYVADQARSRAFYAKVLALEPSLDVPGMTEFVLPNGTILGLAPEADIATLFGPAAPDPSAGRGIPRAELYLLVPDPTAYHARALAAGARELSPMQDRSWGHAAAYSLDPDGHVLAFARPAR